MSGAEPGLPPYLAQLNPEQLEAVRHEGRPLLILAGAGSGKTRVITTKIAYLVRERGLEPESILAVTFTNKAAREMRDRAAAIEPACGRAVMRTFHSFGAWFLRRNAAAAGLDPNFTIYDDDDSTTLVHAARPQHTRSECARIARAIARAKDLGLEPDSDTLREAFADTRLMRPIYAAYEERLRRTGNLDFGDLIRLPAKLLARDEAVRRRTRQRFRVILVDEYQDSNIAQFELLRLLAGPMPGESDSSTPPAYLCVVGDDDQSIYGFRGAEVKNILEFPKIFANTQVIRLERNYRSYQSILDVAGQVVAHNRGRLGKTLRAERPGGAKPGLVLLEDQDEETDFCARVCARHLRSGGRLSDIAILYRTNAQSLSFEKDFPRRGIAYRIVGALRFYEREEIKDSLAYLALLSNSRDEIAFKRVINKPSRGIGEVSVEAIIESAAGAGGLFLGDLVQAARQSAESLRGKARGGAENFARLIDSLRGELDQSVAPGSADGSAAAGDASAQDSAAQSARGKPRPESGEANLGRLVERMVRGSGLVDFHTSQDEIAGTQKMANLEELVNAASLYPLSREGLAEFLEAVELDRSIASGNPAEASGATDAVTLITMHNTKGLEFPLVVVTGLEQGLFPRDDDEGEELEEQRRLFYVAVTRAKDELYLCACRWRRMHGKLFETSPSIFLSEIDPDSVEATGSGRAGARGARRAAQYPRSREAFYGRGEAGERQHPGGQQVMAGRDAQWRAGQAVYHEDYGAGVIVKTSPTPSSGPVVIVRFETGRQAQFFPRLTKKLEILRG